jgi:hypothetical protein
MYIDGFNQYEKKVEPQENLTWLDYIIISNPQGVMKVLADYGYTGYLAPENEDEMMEVSIDLMDKYGDQAVIDLLKSNPLYEVISDISKKDVTVKVPFKNAAGDWNITKTISTIDYKLLIENTLVVIGAFFIATQLWAYITKSE